MDEFGPLWLIFTQERINLATWVAQSLQTSKASPQAWILPTAERWALNPWNILPDQYFHMPGALSYTASLTI